MASVLHRITTIGHSNHAPERFLMMLVKHGVDGVADVRSVPYSRYAPQFDQPNLRRLLQDAGIRYGFLGRELGGRPSNPLLYDADSRVRYERVAATQEFSLGIQRLMRAADKISVALLCTERDPLECHRALLVGHRLTKLGIDVFHILGNGDSEAHGESVSRLLKLFGNEYGRDLFRSRTELIDQAIDRQARKYAYMATDIEQMKD